MFRYYLDPDESPLHLITIAAQRLHRLDVFESPIMRATIDFKWNTFAKRLFYGQFVIFLCFLSAVVVFSVFASRTSGNEDFPAMRDVWGHPQGKVAILISPFVVFFSFLSLTNELQQLLVMGPEAYFASIWCECKCPCSLVLYAEFTDATSAVDVIFYLFFPNPF